VEIAQVAAIAIDSGMRVDDLVHVPLAYPTYTGILANVAASVALQLNLDVGWQAHKVESAEFGHVAGGAESRPTTMRGT
jgi:hypothetical protein